MSCYKIVSVKIHVWHGHFTGVMHQIKRLADSELKVESPVKPSPTTASSSSLSSTSSGSLTSEPVPTEKEGASPPAPEDSPSSSQM